MPNELPPWINLLLVTKCYLIPFSECGSSKKLRFTPPKNGQTNRVSFAKNYELEVIIATL